MAYIGNSPANVGNYQVVDDISSTFNGVLTSFALTVLTLAINPAKSGQLLVSINGVLQEPDDTGTEGFKVSGSNIVFSSAPATGSTFWAVWQGQAVDIGTPSDSTVGTDQLSATGTKSGTTYLAGDNTWKTVVTDLVNDTTPQLGGDLDNNGKDISGTGKFVASSTSTGDYVRMYGSAGTGKWDIYGHGANLRISDNESAGAVTIDTNVGIGTTSPTVALQVEDTDYHQIYAKGKSTVGGIRIGNSVYDNGFIYYDNGANMLFNTNGAERMRIDSAGRVTMPYQPAFYATGYTGQKTIPTSTTTLVLGSTAFNIGGHYNTSNGRFTAPVTGIYKFDATVYWEGSSSYKRMYLTKSGSTMGYTILPASDPHTGQLSVLVDMNANDYIELKLNVTNSSNIYEWLYHTYLTGCLVS
jgi:hypothetical protein